MTPLDLKCLLFHPLKVCFVLIMFSSHSFDTKFNAYSPPFWSVCSIPSQAMEILPPNHPELIRVPNHTAGLKYGIRSWYYSTSADGKWTMFRIYFTSYVNYSSNST